MKAARTVPDSFNVNVPVLESEEWLNETRSPEVKNPMNKTLSTDMELFAAALSQVTVAVIQHTADDIPVFIASGVIEKYTTHSRKDWGNELFAG